jgi:cell wall-associated NlpC family hydrolase
MHAGNKTDLVQKMSPLGVKQAAYGETRAAIIKKKLMKNKLSVEAAAPANAVQQSSTRTGGRAPINFARRNANRVLNTDRVLALLRREAPKFFELAEVVGKWVWIQFADKQPPTVTAVLSELGFHWNHKRQSWQHPCGVFRDQSAPVDPRKIYGSYFAADVKPA